MKKKVLFKAITIMLILILAIITLIIFSKKIYPIKFIENIKIAVLSRSNEIKYINEENITKIDVTDLESNNIIEHEHTLKTMYNENKHWNECTICGQVQNEEQHTCSISWASTSLAQCNSNNSYTETCKCGYSSTKHKPCVWKGGYWTSYNYCHYKLCSVCNSAIAYTYYKNSYGQGEIYSAVYDDYTLFPQAPFQRCQVSEGNIIDCNNPNTCYICKTTRKRGEHFLSNSNDKLICTICNTQYGTITQEVIRDSNTPGTYTIIDNYELNNGAIYNSLGGIRPFGNGNEIQNQVLSKKESNTKFSTTITIKPNSTYKGNDYTYGMIYITIDGIKFLVRGPHLYLKQDLEKPKILSITTENSEELTEWSKTKPIIITGTENFCDTVNVKIVDDENNIIFDGGVEVKNNYYEVSCTPYIEVGINGKVFKAIVSDTYGNETEKTFQISKVDALAPKPTSGTEILGDWAKSKKFTFSSQDNGIGNVKIAFNDIKDLKPAQYNEEEYTRDYEFIGDVYKPKMLSVLYRDELGNSSIQEITIDKLDNTAPNITNVELNNNKIIIYANDEHEKLGEGSGIVKYRYLASEEKIEKPALTIENSTETTNAEITIEDIYQIKYIYIVAEDYVGNVSKVYEVEVPQLILTSTVNLNTADGKGEIILDWSTYDVSDKYFVVYRKQDNQTEWETIVPLTQKLTGNTYTDKLGNDKYKPDAPNITITGDAANNNINITANDTDNGTKYTYYIEAYDSIGILISKSKQ